VEYIVLVTINPRIMRSRIDTRSPPCAMIVKITRGHKNDDTNPTVDVARTITLIEYLMIDSTNALEGHVIVGFCDYHS
jgi:hypothetical protein